MSFDFLPKNIITGKTSDGKKFTAKEYDFGTYTLMQIPGLIGALLVGGLFSAISGIVTLGMLMVEFTGRFNLMYLAVPILSGFWLYDCHHGWIFSAIIDFFLGKGVLIFLCKVNIGCIVGVILMTLFGKTIYNTIIGMSDDIDTRYIIFFVGMIIVIAITYFIVGDNINENWLGVSHIYKNVE